MQVNMIKQFQILITLLCFHLLTLAVWGQTPEKTEASTAQKRSEKVDGKAFIGYVDKNDDGINDKFRDADGDGKNDVDGKAYPHKFDFKDKNKDKINDLWMDRDGDGVNDLAPKLKGKDRKSVDHNVLDVDKDGRNDVTGKPFSKDKHRWQGDKFGFWNEQNGKLQGKFIDLDGDGIDDRMKGFGDLMHDNKHGGKMHDMFIDEDGDGISDGRGDFIRWMGRHGRGSMGKKNSGGRHH